MNKKSASSPALADLPNVGAVVARLLGAAGIRTPGELRRLGAVGAALRIRAIRPADPRAGACSPDWPAPSAACAATPSRRPNANGFGRRTSRASSELPLNVHCFQHVPFEGLGALEPRLSRAGCHIGCTRFFADARLPDPDAVDFLVVLGGPMSVNDEAAWPWLVAEKEFIRRFVAAGKPLLGICLGAQLLAGVGRPRGALREKNRLVPIARAPHSNAAAFRFPATAAAFHWHGETFALPSGAVHLARSRACENQAFQIGRAIGLQFTSKHARHRPRARRKMPARIWFPARLSKPKPKSSPRRRRHTPPCIAGWTTCWPICWRTPVCDCLEPRASPYFAHAHRNPTAFLPSTSPALCSPDRLRALAVAPSAPNRFRRPHAARRCAARAATDSAAARPTAAANRTVKPIDVLFAIQVRLDRENFGTGGLDGRWGAKSEKPFRPGRRNNGRPITGPVDDAVVAALGDTNGVMTTYAVSAPTTPRSRPIPRRGSPARSRNAWATRPSRKMLAEKFHVYRATLRRLNPDAAWPDPPAGTVVAVPDVAAKRLPPLSKIEIPWKRAPACLRHERLLVAHFPCSIAADKAKRPAGETLRVVLWAEEPDYTFDPELFATIPGRRHRQAVSIPPAPTTPVGLAWIGSTAGYGIHGSPAPEDISKTESHGCFRLTNWDALKLVRAMRKIFPSSSCPEDAAHSVGTETPIR
jgi:GMP synthase-like glutamine amidotransferase